MSLQGIVWAIDEAPDVPPQLVSILVGIANHADADGRGAYPTVARLAFYARKTTRQTQTDLRKLLELGLIRLGDQRLVDHLDSRYRPIVYDLAMERRRPRYARRAVEQAPAVESAETESSEDGSRDEAHGDQGRSPASSGVKPASDKPSSEPLLNHPPASRNPAGSERTGKDEPNNESEEEDPAIRSVVDATLRLQPGWRRTAVLAALRQAISAGLPAAVAYVVMVDLADGTRYGPTTAGPQRIIAKGPWWTPGAVFVPKVEAAQCSKHPGQPNDHCVCCAGERRGVPQTGATRHAIPARTVMPANARALLAGILGKTGHRQGE